MTTFAVNRGVDQLDILGKMAPGDLRPRGSVLAVHL
jgi:hypothetical protein